MPILIQKFEFGAGIFPDKFINSQGELANEQGENYLFLAAQYGTAQILEEILGSSSIMENPKELALFKTKDSNNLFAFTVDNDRLDILNFLLDTDLISQQIKESLFTATDNNPLSLAIRSGKFNFVETLLYTEQIPDFLKKEVLINSNNNFFIDVMVRENLLIMQLLLNSSLITQQEKSEQFLNANNVLNIFVEITDTVNYKMLDILLNTDQINSQAKLSALQAKDFIGQNLLHRLILLHKSDLLSTFLTAKCFDKNDIKDALMDVDHTGFNLLTTSHGQNELIDEILGLNILDQKDLDQAFLKKNRNGQNALMDSISRKRKDKVLAMLQNIHISLEAKKEALTTTDNKGQDALALAQRYEQSKIIEHIKKWF